MLLPLAIALQVAAAGPAGLIDRARQAETGFFVAWRDAWKRQGKVHESEIRLLSLHCHADGSWDDRTAPHLISTPLSRKSMCPIWVSADEPTVPDESIWIDNGLRDKDRPEIAAARDAVLALFDSAAAATPGNSWVTGQRVRLNVDQRRFDRAATIVHDECSVGALYCAMLDGFVLESRGEHRGAIAAYTYAATLMTEEERCVYLDIRPFIDRDARFQYDKLPCGQRDKINARFWWLAKPLLTDHDNERLAVQLHRHVVILLHSALTIDERYDWRMRYGAGATAEMILRYGWPSFAYWDVWENREHFKWLGFTDSSANSSQEYQLPRFHSTPLYEAASGSPLTGVDVWGVVAPGWSARRGKWDDDWWSVEHFARAAPLLALDDQVVFLRRASTALVAFAAKPDTDLMPDSSLDRHRLTLLATTGPTDSMRRAIVPARRGSAGSIVATLIVAPGPQILAAELTPTDGSTSIAARARLAIAAPPPLSALDPGRTAISDPLFFAVAETDPSLPSSTAEVLPRMLGSLTVPAARVGVFWELYGFPPSDTVDVTLTVSVLDQPGWLHRLGATLGIIGEDGGTVAVKWREPKPGARSDMTYEGDVPVQARSIVLDMSRLKPGRYAVELSAAQPSGTPARSRKEIRIQR